MQSLRDGQPPELLILELAVTDLDGFEVANIVLTVKPSAGADAALTLTDGSKVP
jgi:hypothetical protein